MTRHFFVTLLAKQNSQKFPLGRVHRTKKIQKMCHDLGGIASKSQNIFIAFIFLFLKHSVQSKFCFNVHQSSNGIDFLNN